VSDHLICEFLKPKMIFHRNMVLLCVQSVEDLNGWSRLCVTSNNKHQWSPLKIGVEVPVELMVFAMESIALHSLS